MSSSLDPSVRWPLHWAVWHKDLSSLKDQLSRIPAVEREAKMEEKDPRGRSPLLLAASLGHWDIVRFLAEQGASLSSDDKSGFNVFHETVTSGDPNLVTEMMYRRDLQRFTSRIDSIPQLLQRIKDTKDFYVEMTWNFSSWLPIVSSFCPSDTYKIYKSGSKVRIDTTLIGFDNNTWQRGNRSFIFKAGEEGAVFIEVDHDSRSVHVEKMSMSEMSQEAQSGLLKPSSEVVRARLSSPMSVTYLDSEKITFERAKCGIIGFRSDRSEVVSGRDCAVFIADNVEVITKVRTEHLTPEEKAIHKPITESRFAPLQSLLRFTEQEEAVGSTSSSPSERPIPPVGISRNPHSITDTEYFSTQIHLTSKDIGLPRDITSKVQKFKATIWLCQDYPLSLQEQVFPIIDLMAISSFHFRKLRDFIHFIPSGFPVRIEIPMFHLLRANVTFSNIFALDESVHGVTGINDEITTACVLDETIFDFETPPPGYSVEGDDGRRLWNEDDELAQLAIQQYLLEDGSDQVTLWEALKSQPDADLQRAIQESLQEYQGIPSSQSVMATPSSQSVMATPSRQSVMASPSSQLVVATGSEESSSGRREGEQEPREESDLELALRLSQEAKEEEDRRRKEEEEILQKVLQLSVEEK